ncbi:DsbA family protein [Candidatus Woesearchaeota archaeon]|nr:DsbA family protein [Candidatus Woesearchaeota archaeon]MBW2993896.1 DsbA family protein [Candidatus Woesearchaeota archaeon]
MSDGEIKISKITLWQGLAGVLFVLLLISMFTQGFGIGGSETPTAAVPAVVPTEPAKPTVQLTVDDIDLEDVPFMGEEDAEITMVIYDDFECPFCSKFETDSFAKIKEEYIDTGKAKFYYKHFPLGFHSHAQLAAEASECAHDQGKFWEMHDKIFENQKDLSEESLKTWAEELELDMDDFNSCLDSHKYAEKVKLSMAEGQKVGVQGTPSVLIEDELVVGAQPFENFKKVIDSKLE